MADKFDLHRDIRFHARVVSAVYDEGADRWRVQLADGSRVRAHSSFLHQFDPRSALAVSPAERLAQYERLWAEPGCKKWLANFYDIILPGSANEDYAACVRQKIRERVQEPKDFCCDSGHG